MKKSFKIDFGQNIGGQDWMIVNDDVMGGLSQSQMILKENSLLFKGELSFENNGGFASIRSSNQNFNLSIYDTVRIKFRSTGRDFALRLASSNEKNKKNYKHTFGSSSNKWAVSEFKLLDFKEYLKGNNTEVKMSKAKLENIIRIGVMISDKKEGQFEIEIDNIEFD